MGKDQGKRASSVEYSTWWLMLDRCTNPDSKEYKNYGGRGITVSQPWLESVNNFIADMGSRPEGRYTLERRDNDKGYSAENCFWATYKEQSRNRRNNRRIEFEGRVQCMTDWALEKNLNFYTLQNRLKRGWTVEEALLTPARNYTLK